MRDLLDSPLITTLLSRSPLPPLTVHRVWRVDLAPEIDRLDTSLNVRAALHLLNDDHDACHNITEAHMGEPYLDHIHYIAHRREPDYPNSRWFARRLSHPHVADVYVPDAAGAPLSKARTVAREFVNAVQRAEASGEGITELEQRQWEEMTKLTKLLIEKGH